MENQAFLSSVQNNKSDLSVAKIFNKEEVIYHQGDKSTKFYQVKRGIVTIASYSSNGKEIFKTLIHEGGFFGDEVIGEIESRTNYAVAYSKEVEVLEFTVEDFWNDILLQKQVMKSSVDRNVGIQQTMEVNASETVEARLVSFFKRIAQKEGFKLLTGETMLRMHLKHKELAFFCNSSRQCVSSLVSLMQKNGMIRMDRQSVILSDRF